MIIKNSERALYCLQAFRRAFGASAQAHFEVFYRGLEKLSLEWVLEKMRREEFPPYPGFEEGLPAVYSYFIPGSGRGSHLPTPVDPLGSEFTARADGIGINMGCPLRLAKALSILERVEPDFAGECSCNLSTPHKHLSTVEELLWANAWNEEIFVDRDTFGNGNKKPDWRVRDVLGEILLEAKYLPSDWARLVDGPHQIPKDVLKKAAAQLPVNKPHGLLNVVGVTGIDGMDPTLGETMAAELMKYPHLDAVIYRGLKSEMWIISLNRKVPSRLRKGLRSQSFTDFQPYYPVTYGISEKKARLLLKSVSLSSMRKAKPSRKYLYFGIVPLTGKAHRLRSPTIPYRKSLTRREADGEPIFIIEPPFLLVTEETSS